MLGEGIPLGVLAARLACRLPDGGAQNILIYGMGAPGDCAPGDIVYAANPANLKTLLESACAAIIVDEKIAPASSCAKPLLIAADARAAFFVCLDIFARYISDALSSEPAAGISPDAHAHAGAVVAPSAVVMERVSILEGACIGERSRLWPGVFIGAGARVGADCVLYPNVVIHERCVIGDRVAIHAGAVIGADGFGYTQAPDGAHRKIPQIGNVVIEDDVEIGANTAIDRATCGSTRIGRGTKIDNLVQVAHNVVVGENNILAAQVGIAGSTTTGVSCIFAGQAGIADHCAIGDRAVIGPQAGVQKRRVPPDVMYMGTPAVDMRKLKKILPYFHRLPDLLGGKTSAGEPPAKEEK